jgi:hypothetical protein
LPPRPVAPNLPGKEERPMPTLGSRGILLLRVSAVVAVVIGAKFVAHILGWEVISLNPLFSGLVAANVFLMGFLLSGVLSDYKESERMPGELAAGLENLAQDVRGIRCAKPEAQVEPCLAHVAGLGQAFLDWFHKRETTRALIERLDELTVHFAALEPWTQANLIARLKQEQGNLRRLLVRIHTIRETSFIASGYLIVDATTSLLCVGLVLIRIDPFYEALFLAGLITFLLVFLRNLIRDLDNPFGYYERASGEDVSLKPVEDAVARLRRLAG